MATAALSHSGMPAMGAPLSTPASPSSVYSSRKPTGTGTTSSSSPSSTYPHNDPPKHHHHHHHQASSSSAGDKKHPSLLSPSASSPSHITTTTTPNPTQGPAHHYQQRLPTFHGRVQSVQSLDSSSTRDLQTPSPDLDLRRRELDPPIHPPLASPITRSQSTHHQNGPMPQPHTAVISSGESLCSSSDYEPNNSCSSLQSPISPSSGSSSGGRVNPGQYYGGQNQNPHQNGSYGGYAQNEHQYRERNGSGPSLFRERNASVPHNHYYAERNSSGPLLGAPVYQERNASGPLLTTTAAGQPQYTRRNSASPVLYDNSGHRSSSSRHLQAPSAQQYLGVSRPSSMYSTLSTDGRLRTPGSGSPHQRAVSSNSYDSRLSSYTDLTQPAHHQTPAPVASLDNSHLRGQVGVNASLLTNRQTLEMYRTNAKKSQDPRLQYELAVFMIQAAQLQDAAPSPSPRGSGGSAGRESPYTASSGSGSDSHASRNELLREARSILERLSGKMAQAQYYLADAYASGLFTRGKEENDKAFPLFVAASKHGHAEAGYRAALCYEFGWGCRKDPAKSVQFYRQSASKNHPGAMTRLGMACLRSDLGLTGRYKEGVKWLKRATDVADEQYPNAPYELACLHETGYGDDVFQDGAYAAQLFTMAAELGHAQAYWRMGDAYEHGKLGCPRDAALSVHFYTGAAQRGLPVAMMALCAWYLVGAEPVLEKNEDEAYQWAFKASESGLPKAEYAVGYFTEMGIGCRRDPLEANVWYVKAAEHGDQRAVARLKVIHEAASGGSGASPAKKGKKKDKGKEKEKEKEKDRERESDRDRDRDRERPRVLEKKQHHDGEEKECVIM
ncbi:uncharacterized protein LAJ45_04557 [Morchella importuna]|uniref:uncharacterized protein n=1 Tax=Morchella importuna TaxID=1174673 RepID=UPI001E8E5797|nr:uncharacterized protein LAJ45_04557 [Morchella importuna]KAH8151355.1 hypothetical protein LAJ45_04557 [Morchella importuna]